MNKKIEPSIILTIDTQNPFGIVLPVPTIKNDILEVVHIQKSGYPYYTRKRVLEFIENFIKQYTIDTIIMEQNKLFIDKIDRHPDPYVMFNVCLGYGLKISIQDKYYTTISYILEIPQKKWTSKVLNITNKFSIDFYKSHILLRQLTDKELQIIEQCNAYKALCLSESVNYTELMNKKYLINKE